jgi:hypothetical protein
MSQIRSTNSFFSGADDQRQLQFGHLGTVKPGKARRLTY